MHSYTVCFHRCAPGAHQFQSVRRQVVLVVEPHGRVCFCHRELIVDVIHRQADGRILRELSLIGEEICAYVSVVKSTLLYYNRFSEVFDLVSFRIRNLRSQADIEECRCHAGVLDNYLELVSGSLC